MVYNILTVGDIHFGAMDPDTQFMNLFPIIDCLYNSKKPPDLIVISGDYFDYKLQLNSKSALRALEWFDILVSVAREVGVKKIRVFKGTEEHDHSQLEAFRSYETEDDFVKIFNINTVEETLPDMKCIYCPDETINEEEYFEKYLSNIMSIPDIGFFHGTFDSVIPEIALQIAEKNHTQNIIFRHKKWASFIKGPMISSHWHDEYDENPLIYIGSYDRWIFGEDGVKGFGLVRYDTSNNKYVYTKIRNPFAINYTTFNIDTSFFLSHLDYTNIAEAITNELTDDPSAKLRVKIKVTDDRQETQDYIKALQQRFINYSRRVKFDVTNTLAKKEKEKKRKEVLDTTAKFGFVVDKGMDLTAKIQRFLFEKYDIAREIDEIQPLVDRYLPK